MSVIASIDGANWVSDMPSLYPIGFSALIIGYGVSRSAAERAAAASDCAARSAPRWSCCSSWRSCRAARRTCATDNMLDRMHVWWSAATQNGISNDPLPFIVLTARADVAGRVLLVVGDLPLAQPVAGPGARRHGADVEHQLHPRAVQLRVRRSSCSAPCCWSCGCTSSRKEQQWDHDGRRLSRSSSASRC